MDTHTLPGEGEYTAETVDDMAVLLPDLSACRQSLINIIYGDGTADRVNTDFTPAPATNGGENNDYGGDNAYDNGGYNDDGDYDGDGIPDSWGENTDPDQDADGDGYPDTWGSSW
jgi:hypothetical protein